MIFLENRFWTDISTPTTLKPSKNIFPFSFIHSIVNRIIKLGNSQVTLALAPALVETYSRLLVYMEIESLGIKGFIS